MYIFELITKKAPKNTSIQMVKTYFLILITTLAALSTNAQNRVIEITGKIISHNTEKAIPFATVLNVEKNTVSLSDTLGFFHITMLEKEHLRISAIGYNTVTLDFEEIQANETNVYIIRLKRKVYELSGIDIFDARWKDFEFDFKNVQPEDNETQQRIQDWFYTLISPQELALITSSTAIGIPIHFKSSREKQLKKLEKIKAREHKSNVIHQKYNMQIVSEITGLKGQSLEDFISWCNFNTEFLYYANDYDIINAVRKRFENYKKRN